jgi:GTPase involved in cell partitioning and DNA repair
MMQRIRENKDKSGQPAGGRGGNGRNVQVSEIWIIKKSEGTSH